MDRTKPSFDASVRVSAIATGGVEVARKEIERRCGEIERIDRHRKQAAKEERKHLMGRLTEAVAS